MSGRMGWEPKILAIVCNWCTYAGADAAGNARKEYPANVRLVRVMCSGRVEPLFVAKAFEAGADGVLVMGCHPGDCHYQEGNHKARRRFELLHRLMEQFGMEPERLRLEWVSAGEADRFVQVVTEMTETVRRLGPAGFSVPAAGPADAPSKEAR